MTTHVVRSTVPPTPTPRPNPYPDRVPNTVSVGGPTRYYYGTNPASGYPSVICPAIPGARNPTYQECANNALPIIFESNVGPENATLWATNFVCTTNPRFGSGGMRAFPATVDGQGRLSCNDRYYQR